MLHVVNPPECMAEGYFLEIHELLEVWGNVKAGYDISGCDVRANEEHFHCQMLINVLYEFFCWHSLS